MTSDPSADTLIMLRRIEVSRMTKQQRARWLFSHGWKHKRGAGSIWRNAEGEELTESEAVDRIVREGLTHE